jgi:hypothetical protein
MHTKFWLGNLKGRDYVEDLGIDGNIQEWILGEEDGKVWTGCVWLRTGTTARLL